MIMMRDVKQEQIKLEKMMADFVVNQMKMSFEKGVIFGKQKELKGLQLKLEKGHREYADVFSANDDTLQKVENILLKYFPKIGISNSEQSVRILTPEVIESLTYMGYDYIVLKEKNKSTLADIWVSTKFGVVVYEPYKYLAKGGKYYFNREIRQKDELLQIKGDE